MPNPLGPVSVCALDHHRLIFFLIYGNPPAASPPPTISKLVITSFGLNHGSLSQQDSSAMMLLSSQQQSRIEHALSIAPSTKPRNRVVRVWATTQMVDSQTEAWKDDFSSLDDRKVSLEGVSYLLLLSAPAQHQFRARCCCNHCFKSIYIPIHPACLTHHRFFEFIPTYRMHPRCACPASSPASAWCWCVMDRAPGMLRAASRAAAISLS